MEIITLSLFYFFGERVDEFFGKENQRLQIEITGIYYSLNYIICLFKESLLVLWLSSSCAFKHYATNNGCLILEFC